MNDENLHGELPSLLKRDRAYSQGCLITLKDTPS